MQKVGTPEWIVRIVQIVYQNTRSHVRINNLYSDVFNVQVGIHQGSVLSPLVFIRYHLRSIVLGIPTWLSMGTFVC